MNKRPKPQIKWKYVYIIPLVVTMLFAVGNSNRVNAKNSTLISTNNAGIIQQDTTVYFAVDELPEFPGGPKGLMTFLGENVTYPKSESDAGVQGRVIVSFVVELDGSLSNAKVVRGISTALDEEAIAVVKKMPNWTPAKQDGVIVRSKYTLPIQFRL